MISKIKKYTHSFSLCVYNEPSLNSKLIADRSKSNLFSLQVIISSRCDVTLHNKFYDSRKKDTIDFKTAEQKHSAQLSEHINWYHRYVSKRELLSSRWARAKITRRFFISFEEWSGAIHYQLEVHDLFHPRIRNRFPLYTRLICLTDLP